MSTPIDTGAGDFESIIAEAQVPVLVDFWAAWCGPCRLAAPHVQQVASDMAGRAVVLKVDTEKEPGLASKFGVRGIPNFLVLKSGQVVMQQAGLVDHHQLKRWLEQAG